MCTRGQRIDLNRSDSGHFLYLLHSHRIFIGAKMIRFEVLWFSKHVRCKRNFRNGKRRMGGTYVILHDNDGKFGHVK